MRVGAGETAEIAAVADWNAGNEEGHGMRRLRALLSQGKRRRQHHEQCRSHKQPGLGHCVSPATAFSFAIAASVASDPRGFKTAAERALAERCIERSAACVHSIDQR
jgi:hypothetical protein